MYYSSYIKMIYSVKINQICITLVYLPDNISKKMRNLNVKLIIEARLRLGAFYMNLLKNFRWVLSQTKKKKDW